MKLRARICALLAVVPADALCGCAGSEENVPPPPVVGTPPDDPVHCSELDQADYVQGKLRWDGGRPDCVADGLLCPLPRDPFGAECLPGELAVAHCAGSSWELWCDPAPEAGAPDASAD
jgi:hypothetical protein